MLPVNVPFIQAIKADPENDQPRFFYADWLEENGETDYANFIRLSIMHANAEAKLGKPSKDEQFPEVWMYGQRQGFHNELTALDAILGKNVHDFECPLCLGQRAITTLNALPEYIHTPPGVTYATFYRGFIRRVELKTDKNVRKYLTPILQRNPVEFVECQQISGTSGYRTVRVLQGSKWFKRIAAEFGVKHTVPSMLFEPDKFAEIFSRILLTYCG